MMTEHYRPTQAYIDLEALNTNFKLVKSYAPKSKILAMIKADGYGHGLLRVAEQLNHADGFGVASIDEAILLRKHGFLHRILLLEGVFSEAELGLVQQHRLDFVIHHWTQIDWLLNAPLNVPCNIWLKFDTGMHRLGFLPTEWDEVHQRLLGIFSKHHFHYMSHFATADEVDHSFVEQQLAQFNHLTQQASLPKSIANSAAIQRLPQSHFDWVRPGIMLYGVGALHLSQCPGLTPVMTFMSQITALKWVEAGETVGYGQTWQASQKTLVGVVAVGYGDGYPRHAPNGTPVLVNGQRAQLIGRVSMDMITLDLTPFQSWVKEGDEVILWGQSLSVDEVAQHCGTIGYELLCGITQRVPKISIRSTHV